MLENELGEIRVIGTESQKIFKNLGVENLISW